MTISKKRWKTKIPENDLSSSAGKISNSCSEEKFISSKEKHIELKRNIFSTVSVQIWLGNVTSTQRNWQEKNLVSCQSEKRIVIGEDLSQTQSATIPHFGRMVLVSLFNGSSTFLGCLMLKSYLYNNNNLYTIIGFQVTDNNNNHMFAQLHGFKYSYLILIIFTHRRDPNSYYHSWSKWTCQ